MIVDDQKVIMGSANINDRSLLGNRDSEVAMVIEDKDLVNITMDGQFFKASKFAHTLRLNIFMEHFGLSEEELMDPLNEKVGNKMRKNASENTHIYRQIFRCYPDD